MPTPFQQRVYAATRLIPRGRVTSYKLLARFIKCRSCQAVGQALKRNPRPYCMTGSRQANARATPCHRVIAADGGLGGFQGCRKGVALSRKIKLLAAEGVSFKNARLSDSARLFDFKTSRS